MSRAAFLWGLGSLTLIVGLVALAMFIERRRRNRRLVKRLDRGRFVVRGAPRLVREQHDGFAEDDGLALELQDDCPQESDLPNAAICPECGTRYAEVRRRCSRDASALQSLH